MGNNVVNLHCARFDIHNLRHRPLGIIFRCNTFDIAFIKVQLVRIFQKYCQFLVVQSLGVHVRAPQGVHRCLNLIVQLPLIAFEQHHIVKRLDHLVLGA